MEKEQRGKRNGQIFGLRSMIIFIFVIAVISLFRNREETLTYSFSEEGFTVEAVSGYCVSVDWDSILSAEEREALELGTLVEGTDADTERSGSWENEEFGQYILCADAKVDSYVVLYTQTGVVAVNFEDEEATASLCQAIEEML